VRVKSSSVAWLNRRKHTIQVVGATVLGFNLFLTCSSRLSVGPSILITDSDRLPAWSPDGQLVAFITDEYDSLANLHSSLRTVVVSSGVISTIRELDGLLIHGLDWSPDGEWLVFSSTQGISKIRNSGDSLMQLTSGRFHVSPSWSAVSNRIFFTKGAEMREESIRSILTVPTCTVGFNLVPSRWRILPVSLPATL